MNQPLRQDATFLEFLLHDKKWALILVPLWMIAIGYMLFAYEYDPEWGGPGMTIAAAVFSALIWLLIFFKIGEGYGDHIRGRSR